MKMGLVTNKNLEDEYSRIIDGLGIELNINIEPDKKEKKEQDEKKE